MRIGLGIPHQQAFLQFHKDHWQVWTSYSKDAVSGTYYALYPDGNCDLVTVQEGEIVTTHRITTGVVAK